MVRDDTNACVEPNMDFALRSIVTNRSAQGQAKGIIIGAMRTSTELEPSQANSTHANIHEMVAIEAAPAESPAETTPWEVEPATTNE